MVSDLPGRLITLFHFLIDPLMNILSKSTNIFWNSKAIKGLDGLPEVYKVGTSIQICRSECY